IFIGVNIGKTVGRKQLFAIKLTILFFKRDMAFMWDLSLSYIKWHHLSPWVLCWHTYQFVI
ncbi:hypothetical protein, partial [Shewanella colwelliana]|uniref:hypothetical protein n=1 Tax=Shewanella colwelliana TaxID=23 RepID=UPI00217F7365